MSLTIPKGKSTFLYTDTAIINLEVYKSFIDCVFQLQNDPNFKVYIPSAPQLCEFTTLNTGLSYTIVANQEFEIVV